MAFFGKKQAQPTKSEQPSQNNSDNSLVQKIVSMKKQGYSNQQIAQILTQQGYENQQIYNSMTKAESEEGMQNQANSVFQNQNSNQLNKYPSEVQPFQQPSQSQQQFNDFQQPQYVPHRDVESYQQQDLSSSKDIFDQKQIDKIEELTEAIIDERWTELMNNIQKIVDWKNRSEERIITLEKSFSELKDDFKRLELAIVGRIKEYDQNLEETLGNVKALNMVFKQILPQFSLDIKSLHRIVDDLKGEHKKTEPGNKKTKKTETKDDFDYNNYPKFDKKDSVQKDKAHDDSDLNDIL